MREKIFDILASFCTAIRFLTVFPVSWRCADDSNYFQRSVAYFPFIGLLIGVLGYLLITLSLQLFPQAIAAALIVLYFSLISGFLHVDGLSDSADGLLSARPREVSLEIMKDSRVGAMGVVAIVAVFLLKYSALSSIALDEIGLAVFFIPVAGRCSILFCMARLEYSRGKEGIGYLFYSSESRKSGFLGLIIFTIFAIIFAPYYGVFLLVIFFGINYLFCAFCKTRLGGATGDTLGAACELTEAAAAIAFTILL